MVDEVPDERSAHVLAGLGALDQRIAAHLSRQARSTGTAERMSRDEAATRIS